MIRPADSDDDGEAEDSDKAVAVKDDPQFTIAVTRGESFDNFTIFQDNISSLNNIIRKKLVRWTHGIR